VQAALEIFEYANSQLLQFRYYDERLDGELARTYKELETSRDYKSWRPRRYTRAARQIHALFIDVTELTDRTDNALKLVGDVYAARLIALVHSRLGVTAWRDSVHDKLKTLDGVDLGDRGKIDDLDAVSELRRAFVEERGDGSGGHRAFEQEPVAFAPRHGGCVRTGSTRPPAPNSCCQPRFVSSWRFFSASVLIRPSTPTFRTSLANVSR
jgi:hypothetical protein